MRAANWLSYGHPFRRSQVEKVEKPGGHRLPGNLRANRYSVHSVAPQLFARHFVHPILDCRRSSTRCFGASKPLSPVGAGRYGTTLLDLYGRGACGVCNRFTRTKGHGAVTHGFELPDHQGSKSSRRGRTASSCLGEDRVRSAVDPFHLFTLRQQR